MRADFVIDQNSPEFIQKIVGVRRGDSGDVVVVQVFIGVAIICKTMEFGGSVEGGGGGIAGFGIGILVKAIAGSGLGALAELGGFDGDVAGAGLYEAFEVGGVVAFDAEVDYVGAAGRVGRYLGCGIC